MPKVDQCKDHGSFLSVLLHGHEARPYCAYVLWGVLQTCQDGKERYDMSYTVFVSVLSLLLSPPPISPLTSLEHMIFFFYDCCYGFLA